MGESFSLLCYMGGFFPSHKAVGCVFPRFPSPHGNVSVRGTGYPSWANGSAQVVFSLVCFKTVSESSKLLIVAV